MAGPSSADNAVEVKTLEARRRQESHSKTERCPPPTLIVSSCTALSTGSDFSQKQRQSPQTSPRVTHNRGSSKDTLTVPWSAVSHSGRWQLRHDCVLLGGKPQEPSLGLARTTRQTQKDFQTNSAAQCIESTTFSWEALKSSSEQMTHDMLCKKTEALQTSGTLMMVTSCVTRCWYVPTSKRSTRPTLKLDQSEINGKQKSITTSQKRTQLRLSGESMRFAR